MRIILVDLWTYLTIASLVHFHQSDKSLMVRVWLVTRNILTTLSVLFIVK